MTRSSEPGGSSNQLQASLTVRSGPGAPSNTNNRDVSCIRTAMNEGQNISGLLADILKQSSLADNAESNLNIVLSLAEELRNYQSPTEFSIGFVGDSGVGMYAFDGKGHRTDIF